MANSGRSNLAVRLATAAVAAPLMWALVYFGPVWGWYALVFAATGVGARELFAMTHAGDRVAQSVGVALALAVSVTVYFRSDDTASLLTVVLALPIAAMLLTLWRLGDVSTTAARMAAACFGPLWLGTLTAIALLRRDQGELGPGYVLMTLMFAWLADSGAYFAGRFAGRTKLYEAVSPKKTVEGFVGALAGAMVGALLAHFWYLPSIPLGAALGLAVVAGALGQLGDLGESLLKRSTGVKDSGGIVPGHGGMLDRIDALLVTSAVVYLYTRWH